MNEHFFVIDAALKTIIVDHRVQQFVYRRPGRAIKIETCHAELPVLKILDGSSSKHDMNVGGEDHKPVVAGRLGKQDDPHVLRIENNTACLGALFMNLQINQG